MKIVLTWCENGQDPRFNPVGPKNVRLHESLIVLNSALQLLMHYNTFFFLASSTGTPVFMIR